MKRLFLLMAAVVCLTVVSAPAFAGSKLEKRYEYTMRKLKLKKETAAKFEPVLRAYLTEMMAANDRYNDLKDKYKSALKAGTITDAQATQLMEAKLECEAKELAAKQKHLVEFKKVLPMKKVWYALDYANDKMSKIEAEK